jgi:cytochrome oxidase assembly protein ShyY1
MSRPSALRLISAIGFGVLLTVLGISLGNWQTRRGDEKAALQARLEAAEAAPAIRVDSSRAISEVAAGLPRRVELHGEFLPGRTVYVDNRWLEGMAGFHVVSPMRVGENLVVLVDRGWIARDARDPALMPKVELPTGSTIVEGLAVARIPRLLELGRSPAQQVPGIWPNLDLDDYRRATNLSTAGFVVQQTNAMQDGLRRVRTRPSLGIEKHRGYALQWYGLAALSAGLTIFFGARALLRQFQ